MPLRPQCIHDFSFLFVGILQCLNATLGLYNTELVSTYHTVYSTGAKVLELPEAERKILQVE